MTNGDYKGMYALIVNDKIIRTMIVDILNRLFGSSIDALPNSSVAVEEKKKDSKREEKYGSDIEVLKQKYVVEFKSGLCIESPLKEIIDICPRTRRRKHSNDYPKAFQRTKRNCGSKFLSRVAVHSAEDEVYAKVGDKHAQECDDAVGVEEHRAAHRLY